MQASIFIQDLAAIMLVAGVTTILCHQFKQPIVLGYLIAGVLLGPYTPNFLFINDEEIVHSLAQIGIIFLLFTLGLEFNLRKLYQVGRTAVITALGEIILMIWLGYIIGRFFGWSSFDSLFLGAILSISSTTIIVKALSDLGIKQQLFSQLIFGILIVEDIFAIVILALLSGIAVTGTLDAGDFLITIAKLTGFLIVSLIVGIYSVPRLLNYIARFKSNELLLVTSLGLCFGFCLLVLKLNYSVALGAFIIGAIIAESKHHKAIEQLIDPLKDMFSAIFFVSVGLMFDISVLSQYYLAIIVITLAVIIGKIITCSLGVYITGHSRKTAVRVGMALAQIGEFSFIIAALGVSLKVTSSFLYPIAIAVSAITTLTTPYLIKYSDKFAEDVLTKTRQ